MPEDAYAPAAPLDPSQAAELSLLVDLEARWENLRKVTLGHSLQDLQARQKAYDAFHAKLVAYNRRYTPTHVPELLLNTPLRLALWCRKMRDLYRQVEQLPQGHCPVHLLEKAYRCADHMATRLPTNPASRPAALPGTSHDTAGALEALAQWCDALADISARNPLSDSSH
jgi:hypothetical protein